MLNHRLAIITACVGMLSFNAEAAPVTTDDCLAKGQCAYVSPTGRVTCGKCPSPPRAIKVPAGTTVVCNDESTDTRKERRGSCSGHGGVASFLTPDAKSATATTQTKP
jgi:hypothetical protein